MNQFENSKEASTGSQPDGHGNNKQQVSERKRDANRRNAQKSTGPNTPKGRGWSSRNSLKHGLCASRLLISGTGNGELNQLLTELREYYEPETLEQEIWIQRLAMELWRQQRGLDYEFHQLERDRGKNLLFQPPILNLLRYQAASNRNLAEALKELERLKTELQSSEPENAEAGEADGGLSPKPSDLAAD